MECNRDEALRAKEIAFRKFATKDIVGARKFALKAQNLFPELEGISQMIATLDIYLASEVKVYGEKDWYRILKVNPSADEETVKKQYRKLALQLHPDKNKSVGAEGAFQLISEAWNVLSDKTKKIVYDQRRNVKGLHQKAWQPNKGNTVPNVANNFHNVDKYAATKAQTPNSGSSSRVPTTVHAPPQPLKSGTFWTSCKRCEMQYEYLRLYLNHNLLCPRCHEPFLATEIQLSAKKPTNAVPRPGSQQPHFDSDCKSASKNSSTFSGMKNMNMPNGENLGSSSKKNLQCSPSSRTAGATSITALLPAAAQAANVVHKSYEKVRRKSVQAQTEDRKEEVLHRKSNAMKRNASMSGISNAGSSDNLLAKKKSVSNAFGNDVGASKEQIGASETESVTKFSGYLFKSRVSARRKNLFREVSQMDIRRTLIDMTKSAIDKKLEEWKSAEAAKIKENENAKKKPKKEDNNREKEKLAICMDATNQNKLDYSTKRKKCTAEKNLPNEQTADSDNEINEQVSIDVPDPDFHNFDIDRLERSFGSDQIWATYDEEDGMPRYYALVQKVISLEPFKVRMSFLTSKSNSEFGPLNWIASGFAKTCGTFRISRYETCDTINIFSHKVKWEKGPRGIIKIIPRKGEVWALYRNWSPCWNEHTPDDIIYKYDMVEVLEDYNRGQGVSVTPLVKVAGFKTVFCQNMDSQEIKRIPKEEMFRFSHQVPSYLLTGEEAQNAPKGCHELDPAATPLELVQVTAEAKTNADMEAKLPLSGT